MTSFPLAVGLFVSLFYTAKCQWPVGAEHCRTENLHIKNGNYDNCKSPREVPVDSEILVECHEGFVLNGSSKVKCLAPGRWSTAPMCVRGCRSPPKLVDANIVSRQTIYASGDNATYTCIENFFATGNPKRSHFTITCAPDGTWMPLKGGCFQFKRYQTEGLEIRPNESVHLVCNIDITGKIMMVIHKFEGKKEHFSWFKDSVRLNETLIDYDIKKHGQLVISGRQSVSIAGIYTCLFHQEGNIIPGKTTYDLKYSVGDCEVSSDQTTLYHYKEGNSAWLWCLHNSSYEGIHWFKDDEYFPSNENQIIYPDGSLYIKKIEFLHEGKYTCMMTKRSSFCSKNVTAEVVVSVSAASICGDPMKSKDHPWTVSLWRKNEVAPFCYGSLVHENWILTTAQCLSGLYRKQTLDIFVRFRDNKTNGFLDIPIISVKIHPFYSQELHLNDIGLAELQHRVQFSSTVQPICLTTGDLQVSSATKSPCKKSTDLKGIKGITSGWGQLKKFNIDDTGIQEAVLVADGKCFPGGSPYIGKAMCSRRAQKSNEALAGDLGSPLEVLWKERVYLLGIYSFGEQTSRGEMYYFTNVTGYIEWISDYIKY